MSAEFKDVMSKRTDEELIKIITIDRKDYQPLAVEAAEEEIKNRNIDTTKIEKVKVDLEANNNNNEETIVGTKKGKFKYGIIIGVIIIAAYLFNAYTTNKENESIDYYNKGVELSESKDYHGAIDAYTKAIELNPKLSEAYYNRGLAKINIQDYNGAIADFTKTIELNPKDAKAYYNRGLAKIDIEDYNGALADANNVIELNPKDAKAYCLRGLIKIELDDKKGACIDFQKSKELGFEDADDYINDHCK